MTSETVDEEQSIIVAEATTAAETFLDAATGRLIDSIRDKGVIATKNDIVKLHLYEQFGLLLPTDLGQVIGYLGYESGAGRELEPEDFQRTFSTIQQHAKRWRPILSKMKLVSSDLKIFSESMSSYNEGIKTAIDSIKGTETLDKLGIKTLEELRRVQLEMGDLFPEITFDNDDKSFAQDFGWYLNKMFDCLTRQKNNAETFKNELSSFAYDLAVNIRPLIKNKLEAIKNTPLKDGVIALKQIIEDRSKEIDENSAAYKKLVQESLKSAAGLNIVGLGMAIYIGVEAEAVRKARNALVETQAREINDLSKKNKILARLYLIQADMQELDFISYDADRATENLTTVWDKLYLYAETSKKKADKIDDAMKARLFATEFKEVATPWEYVLEEVDNLDAIFTEADAEIARLKKTNPIEV